jgi:hypothetical protein
MNSTTDTELDVPSEDLSTDALRIRLQQTVFDVMANAENALIRAPTSLGKSHLFATNPWLTMPEVSGGRPVVQVHPTLEARDDAIAKSDQAGVRYHVLRGREELCPVAAGDYDEILLSPDGSLPSKWFHEMCESRGIGFTTAHREFHRYDSLPCMEGERCASLGRYEVLSTDSAENAEEPEGPDFDVIHATAAHTNVPSVVSEMNVVFDERPDFTLDFEQDHVRQAATYHLQKADPELSWDEMITASRRGNRATVAKYQNALSTLPRPKPFNGEPYFNHLHEILSAVLRARPVGNGRFRGRSNRITVVFDTHLNVRQILAPPNLSSARCVIGLDAHPCPDLWNANLGIDLRDERLLTIEEARAWRRAERGLTVVRLGPAGYARPLTKGWRGETREARKNQRRKAQLIIEQLHTEHPGAFRTCITSKKLAPKVEVMMRDAGIDNPQVMYFGEEKSRNDFATESVGLILGSIDPGDHMILDWLAVLGLYAEPERYENGQRAYGRGFIGKDAGAAAGFLASVREDHIAQSVGRYARSPGVESPGATVYVWSSAIPDDLLDGTAPGVIRNPGQEAKRTEQKQNAIEEMLLASSEPLTPRMIEEVSGTKRSYTLRVLDRLVDLGVATKSEGTGPHGANLYQRIEDSQPPAVDLRWNPV